jgi:gamma-glutamylcyclotransferase (GGCT)/AIG2-like uncharacterized protein YtfP
LVRCSAGGAAVAGELYEVESRLLPLLDTVEGAPELYRLEPIDIEGEVGPVYAYLYARETAGARQIVTGRWVNNPSRDPAPPHV